VVPLLVEDVRFAYQPLINLKTGGIVAIETLPRGNIHDLVRDAVRQRQLTALDRSLALAAADSAAQSESLLPLNINLLAATVVDDHAGIDELRAELRKLGRREHEVTLEIGPPQGSREAAELPRGVEYLRACGFRVALDDVGSSGMPLTLIVDTRPDLIKLAPDVVRTLPDRPDRLAVLESVHHLCQSIGTRLLAQGVDSEPQLAALRRQGIRFVQGNLLARSTRRPPTALSIPGITAEADDASIAGSTANAGPRVTEFLSPATIVRADVIADEVREAFTNQPDITSVVLADDQLRPQWTIDRNRFLLAVTGPYGYALHAKKPASRLADRPLLMTTATTAVAAVRLLTGQGQERSRQDPVVVDEMGRCLGVVRTGDLIRGMAELKVEHAASLNPLTQLPGSESIADEVARRIDRGEEFAAGWLDIDAFKMVNDIAGFSAGDDLIRSVGRSLTDAATALHSMRVAHVGGDDFLLVADPDDLHTLAEMLLDPPRETNGMSISLSLATLVCGHGSVASYDEVSQQLAPLKRRAKSLRGSSWVRSRPHTDRLEILRGVPQETTTVSTSVSTSDSYPSHPERSPENPADSDATVSFLRVS
jgi:diguanylate cyclase (GGDEF)-like protein